MTKPTSDQDSSLGQPVTGPRPTDLARVLRSEELLRGNSEVLIAHGSQIYRLRLTRTGKLILQK